MTLNSNILTNLSKDIKTVSSVEAPQLNLKNNTKKTVSEVFFTQINDIVDLELKLQNFNPKVMAYIGDALFELFVRCNSAIWKTTSASKLNAIKQKIVCCKFQSAFIDKIMDQLTEEEQKIFKWGRNTKIKSATASGTKKEYSKATGFEALLGFLYLQGKIERIKEILINLEF